MNLTCVWTVVNITHLSNKLTIVSCYIAPRSDVFLDNIPPDTSAIVGLTYCCRFNIILLPNVQFVEAGVPLQPSLQVGVLFGRFTPEGARLSWTRTSQRTPVVETRGLTHTCIRTGIVKHRAAISISARWSWNTQRAFLTWSQSTGVQIWI